MNYFNNRGSRKVQKRSNGPLVLGAAPLNPGIWAVPAMCLRGGRRYVLRYCLPLLCWTCCPDVAVVCESGVMGNTI